MGQESVVLWVLKVCQQDLLTTFVAILSIVSFAQSVCDILFYHATPDKQGLKKPPLVPSLIPFIGHVSWQMVWNPRKWALQTKELFQHDHPVSAWLMAQKVYIVQGTDNVQALFRQRHPSPFSLHGFLLQRVFSLPPKALERYDSDDSGAYPKPITHSKVEPHNRIEYLMGRLLHRFLLGPGLPPFAQRFQADYAHRVQSLAIGKDWVEWDNIITFYTQDLTGSLLNALCGKGLLHRHPEFLTYLWTVENNVWKLMSGLPRFIFPQIYRCRDKGLAALKDWHSWASENFDAGAVDAAGDDPIWGSKFFRERKELFSKVEGFDQDAIATHDFAFIWGATNNVSISVFWTTYEAFRDPEILSQVREEAKSCLIASPGSDFPQFDVEKLEQQPMLQAIYAETLRLRIGGFLVRQQTQDDLNVEGWRIPKNHYILTNTMQGHMNPEIWSTGAFQDHPVEEFWPGRFLEPVANGLSSKFSLEMSKGAWNPFGGGHHACPGRRFAKTMNLFATALIVHTFDCEIGNADSKALEMSMRNFGFGIAGPKGNVPVRIRRRSCH